MATKHPVSFLAHKNVKEPAFVSFPTKNGPVAFMGHKEVKEVVPVHFLAKNK